MSTTSHLFLLRELVRRDFVQRYAGSVLGLAWTFIQPIWTLVLLSFVFSIIMRLPLDSEPTERFWVFLFCGLLPWMAVHEAVMRSTTVITEHAEMVKKIRFPSEILLVSVATSALIQEAISLAIFITALLMVGEMVWTNLHILVFALLIQTVLMLGLGFFMAAVHVFFRDTSQVLGLAMNAWFYLTPIVYPLAIVPDEYVHYAQLNPLTILVEMYRNALLGGEARWVSGLPLLLVTTAVAFGGGLWVFRRLKPGFADEI